MQTLRLKASRLLLVDTRQSTDMRTEFSKETLPCHARTGERIGPQAWHPPSVCTIAHSLAYRKRPFDSDCCSHPHPDDLHDCDLICPAVWRSALDHSRSASRHTLSIRDHFEAPENCCLLREPIQEQDGFSCLMHHSEHLPIL